MAGAAAVKERVPACLDKDELLCVAFGITGVADGLDERLTEQFGGKTYGES
ncbi:MAG: hypothetical protein ACYC90_12360 [Candidatus Nanopelagicales bacterium]